MVVVGCFFFVDVEVAIVVVVVVGAMTGGIGVANFSLGGGLVGARRSLPKMLTIKRWAAG